MMSVEVSDLRLASGDGKLKAFVSVKFGGKIIIRGFSVLDGAKGVYVKLPSKVTKDGRWIDTIALDENLQKEVNIKVLEAYDREKVES